MTVRATRNVARNDGFNLSFNDLIAHAPGQPGRGDALKGMYENRNGNVLVIYSKNPQLVEIEARRNRKRTNRTGLTRTGMFMIGKNGEARLVTCNRDEDGAKNWKKYEGSITLAGNPHVVDAPQAGQIDPEWEADGEEE